VFSIMGIALPIFWIQTLVREGEPNSTVVERVSPSLEGGGRG
jgi:hypothetical protein